MTQMYFTLVFMLTNESNKPFRESRERRFRIHAINYERARIHFAAFSLKGLETSMLCTIKYAAARSPALSSNSTTLTSLIPITLVVYLL